MFTYLWSSFGFICKIFIWVRQKSVTRQSFPQVNKKYGENAGLEVKKTPAKFAVTDPSSNRVGEVAAQSRQTRGHYIRQTSQLMLCRETVVVGNS